MQHVTILIHFAICTCTFNILLYIYIKKQKQKQNVMEIITAKNLENGMLVRFENNWFKNEVRVAYATIKKLQTTANGWVKFEFDIVEGYTLLNGEFKEYAQFDLKKEVPYYTSHSSKVTRTMHPESKIDLAD